jgi:Heterokaryon incompatibility protein (HET)
MRNIYEEADETIGWLGETSADSSIAIEFVRTLTRTINEVLEELKDDPNKAQQLVLKFQSPLPWAQSMTIFLGLGIGHPGWVSLMHLFEQPWFSRVWIIQEATLLQHLTL